MSQAIVVAWLCMSLSGVFLAVQSGINFTLGNNLGKAMAAVISFGTGLCVLLVYFCIDVTALGTALPTWSAVKTTPWWSWLGGPLGAFYVTSSILFAQRLGAANALSVFVSFQLVTGLVLDSKGWVGYRVRKFHWARAVGVVLLIVGVFLIAKFDGGNSAPNSAPSPPSDFPPPPAVATNDSTLSMAEDGKATPSGSEGAVAPDDKHVRKLLELELRQAEGLGQRRGV